MYSVSLTAVVQVKWEKSGKHIQHPELFITKLRMAFFPSLQQSLKRSNDNGTALLHTCEKKGDTHRLLVCLWVINTQPPSEAEPMKSATCQMG